MATIPVEDRRRDVLEAPEGRDRRALHGDVDVPEPGDGDLEERLHLCGVGDVRHVDDDVGGARRAAFPGHPQQCVLRSRRQRQSRVPFCDNEWRSPCRSRWTRRSPRHFRITRAGTSPIGVVVQRYSAHSGRRSRQPGPSHRAGGRQRRPPRQRARAGRRGRDAEPAHAARPSECARGQIGHHRDGRRGAGLADPKRTCNGQRRPQQEAHVVGAVGNSAQSRGETTSSRWPASIPSPHCCRRLRRPAR